MKKNIFEKCYQFSSEDELEHLFADSLDLYIGSKKTVVEMLGGTGGIGWSSKRLGF